MHSKARLILEDGTEFQGMAFGGQKSQAGEVVFTTGMVGYDLSLTDPSYAGQILTFTYPLIGNWGVPPKAYWESEKIQIAGLVISDLTEVPSHWQSTKTLNDWLKEENIPGIYGIDTRALTQKLREFGVMLGKIVTDNQDVDFRDPNAENLVAQVSPKELKVFYPKEVSGLAAIKNMTQSRQNYQPSHNFEIAGRRPKRGRGRITYSESYIGRAVFDDGKPDKLPNRINIALLNCGAKKNILRNLLARGAAVYELPWDYDPFENNLKIDGLVISNGPGDPKMAKSTIAIIKKALDKKITTFGICLGNQLLALAAGGDTYKLKFGHRAQNQPTIMDGSRRCFITTQNHGFAVNEKKLPQGFKQWFTNANDDTNEGIIHEKLPFFSVQFHPESNPGPTDTGWLFDYFFKRIMN